MAESYNDPELLAQQRTARLAAYDAQIAASRAADPQPDTSHLTPEAIAGCRICDPDGYRSNGTVCDHIDRTQTAARGIAKVRQALNQGRLQEPQC